MTDPMPPRLHRATSIISRSESPDAADAQSVCAEVAARIMMLEEALHLAEAVGSGPVYSDAPSYDGHWLGMVLEQGGIEGAVSLSSVRHAYGMACLPLFERLPRTEGIVKGARWAMETMRMRQVVRAAEDEEAERPRVHRALPDATALWRTWYDIKDRVAVIEGREGAERRGAW